MSLSRSDTNALIKARLLLARIEELLAISLRHDGQASKEGILLTTALQYCDAILLLARTKRNTAAILALQQSLYLISMELTWSISKGNKVVQPSISPSAIRMAEEQLHALQSGSAVLGPLRTGLTLLSSEIDSTFPKIHSATSTHNAGLSIPVTAIEVCLIVTTMTLQFAILIEHEGVAKETLLNFLDDFLSPVLEDLSYYSVHIAKRGGHQEQKAHQQIQGSLHGILKIRRQMFRSGISFDLCRRSAQLMR